MFVICGLLSISQEQIPRRTCFQQKQMLCRNDISIFYVRQIRYEPFSLHFPHTFSCRKLIGHQRLNLLIPEPLVFDLLRPLRKFFIYVLRNNLFASVPKMPSGV